MRSRVIVGALAVAATTLSMSTQIAHAQLGSTLSEFDCFSGTNRGFRFCPPLCLQAQTMDRATFERRRSENHNQRMTEIAEAKAKIVTVPQFGGLISNQIETLESDDRSEKWCYDNIIKAEDKKEEQRRAQELAAKRAAEMRDTQQRLHEQEAQQRRKLEGLGYRPITVEDFILDGKQLSANSTKVYLAGYFFNGGESSKYMFATQVDAAKAYHSGTTQPACRCSSIMPRVRPAGGSFGATTRWGVRQGSLAMPQCVNGG